MDLNHLHLHVRDVDLARRFYEDLFGFTERVWHGKILFLTNADGFDLALAPDPHPAAFPGWFHFGFRLPTVEAVEAMYARCGEAGAEVTAPLQRYDDLASFRLKDPDGYHIEVYWE